MAAAETILPLLSQALPGAALRVEQDALVVAPEALVPALQWLRDDPAQAYDMLSSLTAVDYPAAPGATAPGPGYLEVVYHLCSTRRREPPLVIKTRTSGRQDPHLPSVTRLYRGAEYQEREAYDLFGIIFDAHPDLRRILMWEGFADYPMRKDYRPPDDHEWEPTTHLDEEEGKEQHKRAAGPR